MTKATMMPTPTAMSGSIRIWIRPSGNTGTRGFPPIMKTPAGWNMKTETGTLKPKAEIGNRLT